jgi:hypothetical protein
MLYILSFYIDKKYEKKHIQQRCTGLTRNKSNEYFARNDILGISGVRVLEMNILRLHFL